MNCHRCHGDFDNVTLVVMLSETHPILKDTGVLDWELCENCASGMMNFLMEIDNAQVGS